MRDAGKARRLKTIARQELGHLIRPTPANRPWQLPVAAALSAGIPLLVGSATGQMKLGLVGSLAGLVLLYLPATPLPHRMSRVMSCSFAMTACYTMGLLGHHFPPVMIPVLIFTSTVMTMLCRFFEVGPPGSLFFVMATAIGLFSPVPLEKVPTTVGVFSISTLSACLIAFFYSLTTLRKYPPIPAGRKNAATADFLVMEPIVIGIFTGLSLLIAQLLNLEKPYWVPISCLVVIQGSSLRAVWTRKVHRLFGTSVGLGLAWMLLQIPFNPWLVSIMVMALTFVVETIVVRHYAIAAIFITPLALLLAEAATLGNTSVSMLIEVRFFDTLLGCFVGFGGGLCLHSTVFRRVIGRIVQKLLPAQ